MDTYTENLLQFRKSSNIKCLRFKENTTRNYLGTFVT